MESSSMLRSAAVTELFSRDQFSIPQAEKENLLLGELNELVSRHRSRCRPYRRIIETLERGSVSYETLADLPYLPVSLFKTHQLASVPAEDVFKVMTSSGTTGKSVSKVFLDRETASLQAEALTTVMAKVVGNQRRPMIIIDTPNVVTDREQFSARGAGVLGMVSFGRQHFYALNDQMGLDITGLRKFLETHAGQPILLFGFTFMVWKYFLQAIRASGETVDLSSGILIHSGGWKKLTDEAVGNLEFKSSLLETTGLNRVHDFYGMVEQVGSVFLEGVGGFLYPPNFADVIIRDLETGEPTPDGTPGLVEVISVLPRSYPGHVLLTEDIGIIHGLGDSQSGWTGKQLEILGRLPKSELRGCSDTHAYDSINR